MKPRARDAATQDIHHVRRTADRVFGHESLFAGQEAAVKALLAGRDVLLVSPTGSGKSLAYQLPGVLLDGCTVVVSPLLALQQDQIDGLADNGHLTRAARISSAESDAEVDQALDDVSSGATEFLFLSPEQLAKEDVRRAVAELRPSLVAVDEAHCVSAWGHDFRPDYFRMSHFIDELDRPHVIALTATASLPVREDIVARLGMRNPLVVATGFARENIALSVVRSSCRTRKTAEEYAATLAERGLRASVYHAGLSERRRKDAHSAFTEGDVEVIVATSAFGMGIDKPDIRFVLHAQVPESPDTYYQEIGRAGRDGEPATAVLFYRPEDLSLGRFFAGGVPKEKDVRRLVAALPSAQTLSDVRGIEWRSAPPPVSGRRRPVASSTSSRRCSAAATRTARVPKAATLPGDVPGRLLRGRPGGSVRDLRHLPCGAGGGGLCPRRSRGGPPVPLAVTGAARRVR